MKRPLWLSELMVWMQHEIDVASFLELMDHSGISHEARVVLVDRLAEVDFDMVIKLVYKYKESHHIVIHALISKLPSLKYERVEDILSDNSIDTYVRLKLLLKVKKIPWKKLEEFLKNTNIPYEIRRRYAEKLQEQFNLENYLDSLDIHKDKPYIWDQLNQQQFSNMVEGSPLDLNPQLVPTDRTLNFYYREWQWSFKPHFEVLISLIDALVWRKTFTSWNKFRLITRDRTDKIIWGVAASKSYWLQFRSENAIFADTIHMTHGTPENVPWSHPIVWKWLYRDSSKLRNHSYRLWEYSRIPLLYDRWSHKAEKRDDYWLWFPIKKSMWEVCDIVVRSLIQADSRIAESLNK